MIVVRRALPGGRAVMAHQEVGDPQPHRFRGFVRANARYVFAYCPLDDSWTAYPRSGGDEDARRVTALVDAGTLVAVGVPDDSVALALELDAGPLAWARADGYAAAVIPAAVDPANTPARVAARRALRDQLRQAHADAAP